MGRGGMSTDESERDDPYNVKYRIRLKPWRNPIVTRSLQSLDVLHRQYRIHHCTKGSPPRERLAAHPLTEEETRSTEVEKVPVGMPTGFYKEEWLTGLDDYALKTLEIDEKTNISMFGLEEINE